MPYLDKLVTDRQTIQLLDTIFDAIYIVDKSRTIKYWNKGAEQVTGYLKTDVLGKKCADNILCHINEEGKLLCRSTCPLVESIKNDINISEKVYPLHKNGNRFPTITNVAPIKDDAGVIVGAIEVFRDISKDEDYRILQEKFNRLVQKYISNNTYNEIRTQLETGKSDSNIIKELSILYLDIVDFTTISESMQPDQVAQLLNDLFGVCDVITRESHGDIDKFIGDSVMATFIDANDAVNAAQKIVKALEQFNDERQRSKQVQVQIRIGINTGKVVQVEVGTQDRKDFTVIGDTVNTASRIESISEPNTIFISESTLIKLNNKNGFHFVGEKMLKGKGQKIKIFKYNF